MISSLKPPPGERAEVLLPNLTSFSFTGSLALLEALITGIVAPSLQELRISASGTQFTFLCAYPHLTSFIHNAGRQFFSAQFGASKDALSMVLSTHPHSTDDPPFRLYRKRVGFDHAAG